MNQAQVAVVTGGARGIGFAIASALAGGGYHVVIVDSGVQLDGGRAAPGPAQEAVRLLAGQGGSAQAVACDVADASQVRAAFAGLEERLGRVDVLVNVAGILRPGPFLTDTRQTWDAVVGTHLSGHINTIGAVLPGMLARGSGRIINFSSTAALLGSRRQPAYSTAKEAVVGLSRRLGSLLASSGVSVNVVSPGAATRMSAGLRAAGDEHLAQRMPELHDRDAAHVGRFVSWLCGSRAAGMTGKLFLTSGNYVIEYEHLRLWKWAMVAAGSSAPRPGHAQLEEYLRWVIGRPHPTLIGPWPTRDFGLAAVERLREGTSIGPDLTRAPRSPASGAALALGLPGERSGSLLEHLDDVVTAAGTAGQDPAARAPGAVVFAPDVPAPMPAPAAGAVALPDPGAARTAVTDLLGLVRSAIEATAHHDDRGVVVVFPGGLPWLDQEASLARWVAWYAAVGLVRGGAATEGLYGVRVNGLVPGPGHARLAGPLARYLLSPASAWLNGYVLTADERGIGLLSDENPRWQAFASGDGWGLPDALLANLSDYRV
ncbi:MAG TPA: SDR family NAD(P)-dependent oxidoreductase [Streptosporangiaceae bacterium]|nr:SDR family NAD(P)-dependent oxidoreductase [Streptosporangiaceae bacterium]